MPIGLHPVFRLPANAGGARLVLPPQTRCWSFPVEVEPGKTAAQPDQRDVAPEHLLDRDGAPLNFRDLPLAEDSEDLLLLTKTGGQITLENHAEGVCRRSQLGCRRPALVFAVAFQPGTRLLSLEQPVHGHRHRTGGGILRPWTVMGRG
jgi:hypothetical protein